jgi:Flp pilus assembly protein TadD
MGTDDVHVFEIAPEDFDAGLLPESARQAGSLEFKNEVRRFFERNLAAFAGWHDIAVEDDKIRVSWKASADKADALSEIIKKLRDGEYQEGIQLLRFLLPSREKDAAVRYNLGMALSDTGELDEAEEHLRKAVEIDPDFTEPKVALGVALSRKHQWEQAVTFLEDAVAGEPDNPYALRTLAACLLKLGRDAERATEYLRKATAILPDDQQSWMNLGQALEAQDRTGEADPAYRKAVEINPGNAVAETARRALSRIAELSFKGAGTGGVRSDAVMFCLSAIEKFSGMSRDEIQRCAFEIAMLGTKGISVNSPDKRYTLKSMEGTFSGLQLVCYEYVGFKRIAPQMDIGFDLSKEYEAALELSKQP